MNPGAYVCFVPVGFGERGMEVSFGVELLLRFFVVEKLYLIQGRIIVSGYVQQSCVRFPANRGCCTPGHLRTGL